MIRRPHLAILGCFLAACASTSAQEEKTLNVRTLMIGDVEVEGTFLQKSSEFLPVRFPKRQMSENLRITHRNPLPVYQLVTSDGEERYASIASAKIPSNAKRILLLGWKKGDNYGFRAIPDDFGTAGPNSWLLINTTTTAIAFQIGKDNKPIAIKPGESVSHRVSVSEERGVSATGVIEVKGEMKTFYSTYWAVRKDKRNVILFLPRGEKIIVKKIIDPGVAKEDKP